MSRKPTTKALGRGLSALLGEAAEAEAASRAPAQTVPLDLIRPNSAQPRRHFDEAALHELSSSIEQRGILQPLILRPDASGEGYQIVAGERRWRAAQLARLHEAPAIIKDLSDADVLEIAIVENVQRADLTPLEEARGYQSLIDRFGHTQDGVARLVGKSRPHVANMIRLLALPEQLLEMLETGQLTAGHARAVAGAPDPVAIAREVVLKSLSVRDAEKLARQAREKADRRPRPKLEKDPDTRALEADLGAALGLSVLVEHKGDSGAGELRIRYRTLEDLDGLCRLLSR